MNKPVAWMREDGVIAFHAQKEVDSQGYKWQPLYTHPVKESYRETHEGFSTVIEAIKAHPVKELTDEEILEYSDVFALDYSPLYEFTAKGLVLFARAILRKAQEK